MVDWGALLGLMTAAAEAGADPFAEAVRVQERLFTTKPIILGVEASLRDPDAPCGLKTDAERARHVRRRIRELQNSRGEWQPWPKAVERPLRDIRVPVGDLAAGGTLRPALADPAAVERVGTGTLVRLEASGDPPLHGRAVTVADQLGDGRIRLAKWVRRLTCWTGREASAEVWTRQIVPLLERRLIAQKTPLVRLVAEPPRLVAHLSLADLTLRVPVDAAGVALWRPAEREVLPADCARCRLVSVCRELSAAAGTALLWRRLGLVGPDGVPTRRGRIVSCFAQGYGLAIAAGLEDEAYPLDELIYDVANLDAGFRFCGDDNRWGGRLALVCHERYGLQTIPGYLENGLPPKYGAGAEQIVAGIHRNPASKPGWISDLLGAGDIDRVIIEWRSLLRQIAHAPELAWPRWLALQHMARAILREVASPTPTELPPLPYSQTRRVEHRLILRRH
jgi:hypothetical protein